MRSAKKALIAFALLLSLTGCGAATGATSKPSATTTTPSQTRFEKAVAACPAVAADVVSDKGKSIHLSGEGEEAKGMAMEDIACVFSDLDLPSSVVAKIDRTNSLMGVQTETWEGMEISWTYHPDNGADFILVDKS